MRIETLLDAQVKAEVMAVVRSMFPQCLCYCCVRAIGSLCNEMAL